MPTLSTTLVARKRNPPYWFGISHRRLFEHVRPLEYLSVLFRTRADIVLWREKDMSREENRTIVKKGVGLAAESGRLFFLSTDYQLAIEEHTDGAHLASDQDLPEALNRVRELGPPGFLLGKSVHSLEGAVEAEEQGADYLLLAPIFDPISKPRYRMALGLEVLREAARAVSVPVFALGGITDGNGLLALEAGAFGLAGISLLVDDLERGLSDRSLDSSR